MSATMVLGLALGCAALAIIYGVWSIQWILAKPSGNDRMREIAAAVQQGATGCVYTVTRRRLSSSKNGQ